MIGLTIWVLNLTVDLMQFISLRPRGSNASVFRSYSPWRGSPWLLTRTSYFHRRNTETKVLVQKFLVCGRWQGHAQNEKFSLAVWNVWKFLHRKTDRQQLAGQPARVPVGNGWPAEPDGLHRSIRTLLIWIKKKRNKYANHLRVHLIPPTSATLFLTSKNTLTLGQERW